MKKTDKQILIINLVIFILALIGTVLTYLNINFVQLTVLDKGKSHLKYFTIQSNVFCGIVAFLYFIFMLKNKDCNKLPRWLVILKFIATIDLIITFLVVALFLGFIVPDGYFSVFYNSSFLFHLVIPVLNFISFLCLEPFNLKNKKYVFYGIIHILLYSVFYIIIVLTHVKNGKIDITYDWYAFAQKGIIVAIFVALILLAVALLISYLLWKIKNKISKEK